MPTTIPVLLIVLASLYAVGALALAAVSFCSKAEALPSTFTRACITLLVMSISLYLYGEGVDMTEKELANLLSLKDLAECSNTEFASDEMVAVHQTGANFARIG